MTTTIAHCQTRANRYRRGRLFPKHDESTTTTLQKDDDDTNDLYTRVTTMTTMHIIASIGGSFNCNNGLSRKRGLLQVVGRCP